MPVITSVTPQLLSSFVGTARSNTPEGAVVRAGGKTVTKTITLSANNTSASVNLFSFTGTLSGVGLQAEITAKTTLTNLTAGYWDLWDGTNSVVLTKVIGGVLSGMAIGTYFAKTLIATSAFTVHDNSQVRMTESAGSKVPQAFTITAKTGVTNYLRFNYATTDAPINAQVRFDFEYIDRDSGTITAV